MLEAKNVVKTFDGFRALDGATLTAPAGAVYGLVGPNGAGKSTLIRHPVSYTHLSREALPNQNQKSAPGPDALFIIPNLRCV